ncbi:hypothetical protein KKG83_02530 [Candidatus Micrarchaeota archaeon]|nr:hypothetical protein [Candidatus Micrarchaeota archaeon]MBU2476325.1 hypothetical protein [Candidatus Micrarchaeota archaeon]
MKKKILVFGNLLLENDSVPLKILHELRKEFPQIEFKEFDPSENLEKEGKKLEIIDCVQGIKKCTKIKGTEKMVSGKIFSLHDFDLGANLKLLEKAGLLEEVTVFGVPMHYTEKQALKELKELIKANYLKRKKKTNIFNQKTKISV